MGIKIAMQLLGTRELYRTLDRASAETRKRVATAVAFTAQEVALGAKARVPQRTGELRDTIRAEPTTNPFVWFVKAGYGRLRRRSRATTTLGRRVSKARRARAVPIISRGAYAMVVEFGSHGGRARQPAQPFMFPALEASHSRHVARIARAMDDGAKAATRGVRQ
jgi:hypothetical protein